MHTRAHSRQGADNTWTCSAVACAPQTKANTSKSAQHSMCAQRPEAGRAPQPCQQPTRTHPALLAPPAARSPQQHRSCRHHPPRRCSRRPPWFSTPARQRGSTCQAGWDRMEREGSPGHPAVLRGGLGLCGRGKNTYRRNRHVRDVDVDVENLDVGHDRTARAERGQPSTGAQGAQGGQLDDVRTLGQGTDTARVQREGKREIGRGRGGRAGDGEPVVDMVELDYEEDWGPPGDEPWLAYCECTHPKGAATALVWTRESTGRGSWVRAKGSGGGCRGFEWPHRTVRPAAPKRFITRGRTSRSTRYIDLPREDAFFRLCSGREGLQENKNYLVLSVQGGHWWVGAEWSGWGGMLGALELQGRGAPEGREGLCSGNGLAEGEPLGSRGGYQWARLHLSHCWLLREHDEHLGLHVRDLGGGTCAAPPSPWLEPLFLDYFLGISTPTGISLCAQICHPACASQHSNVRHSALRTLSRERDRA